MRHLRSILYALVLAPAAWVLTGVGFTDDLHGRARQYSGVESFTGLLLLLLAGAAYAILVFAPISPAGPTLFGVAFLGVTVWALAAPSSYASVWPAGLTKPGFDLSRPGYGLAALLAVPMICTALSVRRWERYEPPQLPLIGVWGRPRGAAAVAGTPVAAETTQVIPQTGLDGDATQVIRPGKVPEPAGSTQVIEVTEPPTVVSGSDERTDVVASEEPTLVGASEEPTAVSVPDEPTVLNISGEPTASSGSDEPVTDVIAAEIVAAESPAEERASDQPASDQSAEAKTDVVSLPEAVDEEPATVATPTVDEPTEVAMPAVAASAVAASTDAASTDAKDEAEAEPAEGDADPTEAKAEPVEAESAAAEPPTQVVIESEPAEPQAEEEPAVQAEAETEPATAEAVIEPTPAETEADSTEAEASQAEAQAATESTQAETKDEPNKSTAKDTETEKRPIGERTANIPGDQEKTQIIRLPVGEMPTREIRVNPGERTQVIPRDHHIDETQVIRLPQQRTDSTDGERTQVIRLNTSTVEPPADRTQVLRLPTQENTPAGPAPVPEEKTDRPKSIVGAERPDPGADPTTRLTAPQPGIPADAGEETTADVGNGKRAMTVMNLERPAGEAADDTRPLIRPHTPRTDDETV